jgi:predicted Zn-dependent protease with MMP-like domain
MDPTEFEELVEREFASLPEPFHAAIDNVRIIVEDFPTDEIVAGRKLGSRHSLLGLYHGIPLPYRNTWYGTNATMPDTITLFRANIESISRSYDELVKNIRETLIHEIGHYFGMSEDEVRAAGY